MKLSKFWQALLKPDFYEAHKYLGFNLLSKGKLKEGLEEIEWRLKIPKIINDTRFLQPIWDGKQSLNDKRFLYGMNRVLVIH